MKKTVTYQKLRIIFLSILLCLYNYISTSIIGQIVSFWVYIILIVIIMHGDFLHPYIWHIGMTVVYYTAYPILYSIGYRSIYNCNTESLFIVSLCILAFVLIVPGYHVRIDNRKDIKTGNGPVSDNNGLSKWFMHAMTGIILIASFAMLSLGFNSKVDIYSRSPILTAILSSVLIYINVYILEFCACLSATKKIDKGILVEVAISTFAISIISGERDILYRMIVVTVLMLYSYKKINNRQLIIISIAFIFVIIPLSTKYKAFFLRGYINERDFSGITSFVVNVFSGDFESASRNLQIIVNNKETTYGIMRGTTWVSDILSVFGLSNNSGLRWFQNTFFAGRRTGMGFTIIGEGLINFGWAGAVLEYVFLSIFIRILYKNFNKGIYYRFFYYSSIPILIYANRADFANILSPFVKHILFSALLFHFLKNRIKAKRL